MKGNKNPFVGIAGWGGSIPIYAIRTEEMANVWGFNPDAVKRGLKIQEKSVPGHDQDVATLSIDAGRFALARARIDPQKVGHLEIGSESHPYAVKPTGTIVGEALGVFPDCHVADLEFACKAGSHAMHNAKNHAIVTDEYGMSFGSDTSQGAPGDALEFTASAGSAAFVLSTGNDVVAVLEHEHSVTRDIPDFYRREGQAYPQHAGRFTGDPAYFLTLLDCAKKLLAKSGLKPSDFDYVVFHQPNGKFPMAAAKKMGFTDEQLAQGMLIRHLGNTYSGSSPLGLVSVLDVAKPGQRIFYVSYGSGAGSDGFTFKITDRITEVQGLAPTIHSMLHGHKKFVTYGEYLKLRGKIILNP